jgi:hypothetical protein
LSRSFDVPLAAESRTPIRAAAALVLSALLSLAPAASFAEPPPAAQAATLPTAGKPTRAEINAAVEKLQADPNLGTTIQKRVLRWNDTKTSQAPPPSQGWLKWIGNLFEWIASTARILVWVVAILLVGILALAVKRLIESRGERSRPLAFTMPTHVQDLDIRPESLPDNIGSAALELWERGQRRAALALLYRGLLSRLAHVHGVPIRDSSTEGDCLMLANQRLAEQRAVYATQLIRVWQRAVYGNLDPTPEEFRALTSGFAAALDPVPEAVPVEQAA